MAEVFYSFSTPVSDELGAFHTRVVGRQAADGMWEGWLEFVPLDNGPGETLVTSVESRQPERAHLAYWATGLSDVYAEGALKRARNPVTVSVRAAETPESEAPAPRIAARHIVSYRPEAVLDPFEVGGKSLDVLRQELGALNRPRLLNIVAAYALNPSAQELAWMTDEQLIQFIVVAVETQTASRR